ncbi:DsbA family protein [Lelliottia sp. WAP21]|uniref:DsbA family protein n=1 Tax=Lelliottia sp. WAP21 TaxID=2877426 RepID=UPI001E4E80A2|nr:DsbA family protein [Lelliottia sp. WAP21]
MNKIFLTLILLFASLQVFAAPALSPEQEARVQALVKETLLNHPEILAQVADKLDQQNAQASQDELKKVIDQNKAFLYNDPNSPRLGAKNPKLTLVVFTDYNCPYCKKFDPYLEKIVHNYPEVAVVFKFLPYRAESSVTAARDALTVWRSRPDDFMKFNDILMLKKGYHDNNSIQEAKKKVGVVVDKPDDMSFETLKKSLAVAEKLGIQGTPATLIGDEMLGGWVPYDQFETMVKDALKTQ